MAHYPGCTCYISNYQINYCPLHEAAPKLLEILMAVDEYFQNWSDGESTLVDELRATLRKVMGVSDA